MTDDKTGAEEPFPSIEAEYGRNVEVWEQLIAESGIEDVAELAAWLESEHGVGREHAEALAEYFLSSDREPADTSP